MDDVDAKDLRAAIADRAVLARHVDRLTAPVGREEALAVWRDIQNIEVTMARALERFIAKRHEAGLAVRNIMRAEYEAQARIAKLEAALTAPVTDAEVFDLCDVNEWAGMQCAVDRFLEARRDELTTGPVVNHDQSPASDDLAQTVAIMREQIAKGHFGFSLADVAAVLDDRDRLKARKELNL